MMRGWVMGIEVKGVMEDIRIKRGAEVVRVLRVMSVYRQRAVDHPRVKHTVGVVVMAAVVVMVAVVEVVVVIVVVVAVVVVEVMMDGGNDERLYLSASVGEA